MVLVEEGQEILLNIFFFKVFWRFLGHLSSFRTQVLLNHWDYSKWMLGLTKVIRNATLVLDLKHCFCLLFCTWWWTFRFYCKLYLQRFKYLTEKILLWVKNIPSSSAWNEVTQILKKIVSMNSVLAQDVI